MPTEILALFDEVLSQVFEHQSLEENIQILASSLNRRIPFSKFTWYVSDTSKRQYYPLVMYDASGVHPELSPHFFDYPPPEWVRAHTVDKEFSIVIENDSAHEGAGFHNVFAERRSLLGMSLFVSEFYTISMTLTSPVPNQFTPEHAELLRLLHTPLGRLAHSFFKSQPEATLLLSGDAQGKLSSLELLKRCRGLRLPVRLLEGVAVTDSTVLLQGESGVGKELFADSLHTLSSRMNNPFIRVNCAAITPSLLDDAFFGHEKGAFTGAANIHLGYFEQATGGTLFLDEIGELSLSGQARLLRVLESHEVMRVGGQRRIMVDVRLVAATHRDLRAMVRNGTFREDLWYRLSVFPLFIPPLRQRKEDIPVLARWFHSSGVKQIHRPPVPALTDEYIASLLHQAWPGNVRQLRHHIDQSIIYANIAGSKLMKPLPVHGEMETFYRNSPDIEEDDAERTFEVVPGHPADNSPGNTGANTGANAGSRAEGGNSWPHGADMAAHATNKAGRPKGHETLQSITAKHIEEVLEQCHGRIQGPFGAAAVLGIHPSTLRSRMKKLGINRPE